MRYARRRLGAPGSGRRPPGAPGVSWRLLAAAHGSSRSLPTGGPRRAPEAPRHGKTQIRLNIDAELLRIFRHPKTFPEAPGHGRTQIRLKLDEELLRIFSAQKKAPRWPRGGSCRSGVGTWPGVAQKFMWSPSWVGPTMTWDQGRVGVSQPQVMERAADR